MGSDLQFFLGGNLRNLRICASLRTGSNVALRRVRASLTFAVR